MVNPLMYADTVNVPITELRAHLSDWLEQARSGEQIIVTDRDLPVARLIGFDTASTLERLTLDGVISMPFSSEKIKARGRLRPSATSSVADLVSSHRR
jgi:prevent-host-death family protein